MLKSQCKCLWMVGLLVVGVAACIPPPPKNIAPIISGQDFEKNKDKHRALPENSEPLSLNYCVQLGLQNNPDFLSKAAAVSAAWARYYQSLSGYLPNLTMNAAYNGTATHLNGYEGTSTLNASSVGLSGQYLIFNGLVREMNMLSAEAAGRQAEHLNVDARRILIRTIGTTYTQIQLYREEVAIQKQNVDLNLRLIEQAVKQYEAGTASLADVLFWKVKYNDSQIALIQARFNERITRYVLAALMGLTDAEVPMIEYSAEEKAQMLADEHGQSTSNYPDDRTFPRIKEMHSYVLADVNVYLDAALKNRPDLKAYREALKQSEYNLVAQYGGFMPTIYAVSSLGANANYKTGGIDNANTRSVGWGANATWNIFEGFNTWNRVREAQATLEISQYTVAQSWITVVSEVRQAHANYIRFAEALAIAQQRLESATKSYDLVYEQYLAGTIEVVRVNESLLDRITAEIDVARYMINAFSAQITLEAAAAYNI